MFTHRQITLREANAFVGQEHRHHGRARGCRFALGAFEDGRLCGVAICGRPVARHLATVSLECTRLATDGTPLACSFLYARCRRVAQALGYTSLKTYTLATEPGASLRAVGARDEGLVKGRSWDRPKRGRVDSHPTEDKRRWELMPQLELVGL